MGRNRARARGFNLIEVVVVIAIMGIVLALGLPGLQNMIQNGRIRNQADNIAQGLQVARTEAIRRNRMVMFQFVNGYASNCALTKTGPYWLVTARRDPDPADPNTLATAAGFCDLRPSPQGEYSFNAPAAPLLGCDPDTVGREPNPPCILHKPDPFPLRMVTMTAVNPTGQAAASVNINAPYGVGIDSGASIFCFDAMGQLTAGNGCGSVDGSATSPLVSAFDTNDGYVRIDLTAPPALNGNTNDPNHRCVPRPNAVPPDPDGNIRCLRVIVGAGGGARVCDPAISAADDERRCP